MLFKGVVVYLSFNIYLHFRIWKTDDFFIITMSFAEKFRNNEFIVVLGAGLSNVWNPYWPKRKRWDTPDNYIDSLSRYLQIQQIRTRTYIFRYDHSIKMDMLHYPSWQCMNLYPLWDAPLCVKLQKSKLTFYVWIAKPIKQYYAWTSWIWFVIVIFNIIVVSYFHDLKKTVQGQFFEVFPRCLDLWLAIEVK